MRRAALAGLVVLIAIGVVAIGLTAALGACDPHGHRHDSSPHGLCGSHAFPPVGVDAVFVELGTSAVAAVLEPAHAVEPPDLDVPPPEA